jgi:hypothetical protein
MSKKQQAKPDKQNEQSDSSQSQSQAFNLNYIKETKNLQYTIVLREHEIQALKKDNAAKASYIITLEADNSNLRSACLSSMKSEKDLQEYKAKYEQILKDIAALKEEMLEQERKFNLEKKQLEDLHQGEISRLKLVNESYHQKIETVNQLIIDKQVLSQQVEELTKERDLIIKTNTETMRQKEIKNEIKFTNLKKKMMDNINQTQSKVTELNIQYMDVSTKLTLLQNHQLLIQLEYQSHQIDELTEKKEQLEKKVFELTKDIEIHKEVELSLAEKNKKYKNENAILKKQLTSSGIIGNNNNNNNNINNSNSNLSIAHGNNVNNSLYSTIDQSSFQNEQIMNLEKKVLQLEKKLNLKCKEYNRLKDNSEFIESRLNNYQKKYLGLFNFFEEAIRLFCEDEQVKNNKELYLNLEMIQKCDFSNFSKEEKYAVLVILMKYLMPLVNMSQTDFLKVNNIGLNVRTGMNHINLKFKYNYTTLNSLNNSGITGNKAKFTNGNTYRNRNSIGEDSEMKRMFKNKSDLNMMNVGGGITSKKGTFSKMHNNSVDSLPIIKNNGIVNSNSNIA